MKQALRVIDVQRALFDVVPRPHEGHVVVDRINALSRRARAAGVPVIWIQHEDSRSLPFESDGWQLAQGVELAAPDLRIRKRTPDSFLNTGLNELLAEHKIGSIVVAGYASEFCVDTTVRRAAALGYPVVIASDAHTTHDKPHATGEQIRSHHNATLPGITSFGPKIEAVRSVDVVWAN
ncbi:cysteine hydrolase family protein [Comamonadaceae bacterium PP-2]